jgi:hypothetical protein
MRSPKPFSSNIPSKNTCWASIPLFPTQIFSYIGRNLASMASIARRPLGAKPIPALRLNQYASFFRGCCRVELRETHPTAENSSASSYSVKEMHFLCKAIASANPPIPAPVVCVSLVTWMSVRKLENMPTMATWKVFVVPDCIMAGYMSQCCILWMVKQLIGAPRCYGVCSSLYRLGSDVFYALRHSLV